MKISKRSFDALVLILFFLATSAAVLTFRINALVSQILYLVLPSIYLLIKYRDLIKRVLFFALPLGVILSIILQFFAEKNGLWYAQFLLPRVLNLPLDVFLWYPFWVLLVVLLYEIFVDFKSVNKKISKNYKWFIASLFSLAIIFAAWLKLGSVSINTAYTTILSLPVLLSIVYIIFKDRKLLPKLITFSLILLPFSLVYELIGIKLHHWEFSGEYIGLINIAGLSMPIEEFILWIMLGSASIAAYYEIFVDDLR